MAVANPPFLSIAAELRQQVYDEVLRQWFDHTESIKINRSGVIANKPALLDVCCQIRTEALSYFTYEAPMKTRIDFSVHDFDFTHAINFFRALTAEQLQAISKTYTVRLKESVKFTLTVGRYEEQSKENLTQWLEYCGRKLNNSITNHGGYVFAGGPAYNDRTRKSLEDDLQPIFEYKDRSSFRGYQIGAVARLEYVRIERAAKCHNEYLRSRPSRTGWTREERMGRVGRGIEEGRDNLAGLPVILRLPV